MAHRVRSRLLPPKGGDAPCVEAPPEQVVRRKLIECELLRLAKWPLLGAEKPRHKELAYTVVVGVPRKRVGRLPPHGTEPPRHKGLAYEVAISVQRKQRGLATSNAVGVPLRERMPNTKPRRTRGELLPLLMKMAEEFVAGSRAARGKWWTQRTLGPL